MVFENSHGGEGLLTRFTENLLLLHCHRVVAIVVATFAKISIAVIADVSARNIRFDHPHDSIVVVVGHVPSLIVVMIVMMRLDIVIIIVVVATMVVTTVMHILMYPRTVGGRTQYGTGLGGLAVTGAEAGGQARAHHSVLTPISSH